MARSILPAVLLFFALAGRAESPDACFGERIIDFHQAETRIRLVLPPAAQWAARPTRLIVYALPNGNSIEWTVGAKRSPGVDWHYDIQHIGAQMRRWQEVNTQENLAFAYVEAEGKSWPAWRAKRADANETIRKLVEEICARVPGDVSRLTLSAHSGGGSFVSGFIEGGEAIPKNVDRIVYLDANYSYDDDKHAAKLLAWLKDADHRFIVMAYDDRNIELNGKKVVSDTGGTYRATHRLIDRFAREIKFDKGKVGDFDAMTALDGRVRLLIHPNPQNKILHTTMVGEMSGFLYSMCVDTPAQDKWGTLQGEKTWDKWIQPAPDQTTNASTQPAETLPERLTIPPRPQDAIGGLAFMKSIEALSKEDREAAIAREFLSGNVPSFLRTLQPIRVKEVCIDGIARTIEYHVMPDYLAIGGDEDFVRVPMNPYTAQTIADAFGCILPTRKMVDDIDRHATLRLEPRPLTEAREAVATFIQHHQIIEQQRKGNPLGKLICGIKKDVVITNRLLEKPNRIAIYGWRKLDGKPIQPLTIVHVDWYVDYSHGVRLVQREVSVDGKRMLIDDVLKDPHLHVLLSDEGVMKLTRY